MRLERADRWLGPFLIVAAAVWLWLCYSDIPGARSEGEPGPRAFPVLLGIVLCVLGCTIALSAFFARPDKAPETIDAPTRREGWLVVATFSLLMLYAFLLDKAGFLIATPVVVILALQGLLRIRAWMTSLALAAALTSGCWLFFALLLKAPLPRGAWFL